MSPRSEPPEPAPLDPRRRGRKPHQPRSGQVEGIGNVLDDLLVQRPWRAGLAVGDLARRWDEVVGERLAAESSPGGITRGVLFVRASSAAWAGQIGFLEEEIRRRANEALGWEAVTSVKVSVGGGAPAAESPPAG